jgi:hypothetical protein
MLPRSFGRLSSRRLMRAAVVASLVCLLVLAGSGSSLASGLAAPLPASHAGPAGPADHCGLPSAPASGGDFTFYPVPGVDGP